jgi:hypothetical protein
MIDGAAIARNPCWRGWMAGAARGLAGGGAFAIVLACLVWSTAAARLEAPMPPRIEVPQVAGWHRVGTPLLVDWTPRAQAPITASSCAMPMTGAHRGHVLCALCRSGAGAQGDRLWRGALPPGSAWQWQGPGAGALAAQGDRLLAHGHIARLAQTTGTRAIPAPDRA